MRRTSRSLGRGNRESRQVVRTDIGERLPMTRLHGYERRLEFAFDNGLVKLGPHSLPGCTW